MQASRSSACKKGVGNNSIFLVRTIERDSKAFNVKVGLHQGSVLSPLLFVIVTVPMKMNTRKPNVIFSCSMKDRTEEIGKWSCGVYNKGVVNNSILCHSCNK